MQIPIKDEKIKSDNYNNLRVVLWDRGEKGYQVTFITGTSTLHSKLFLSIHDAESFYHHLKEGF